jgi:hypothetical protein
MSGDAVTFEWDGKTYTHEFGAVTVKQAVVIKDRTKDEVYPAGRSIAAWMDGILEMDAMCVACLLWVIKGNAGEPCDPSQLDFPILDFLIAVGVRTVNDEPTDEVAPDPTGDVPTPA